MAGEPSSSTDFVRDWGPVIEMMWLFQSLETYTGVV